jgi:uncharacterized phiE125 gp8 family phage protein
MSSLVRVVEPATDPVSVAEAKEHLRVDLDDENDYIAGLIAAATSAVEERTGRQLVSATWRLKLDGFPPEIRLTRVPVVSVSSVTYLDAAGDSQTLSPDNYQVDTDSQIPRILPEPDTYWPVTESGRVNAVTVTFVAGYGTAADVPERAKLAIKLLVGHWFYQRAIVNVGNIVSKIPESLDALISSLWTGHLS